MKSSLTNMIMVLLVITSVTSAAVGAVYQLTLEPIRLSKENKLNSAIAEVMPEFTELAEKQTVKINGGNVVVYPAQKDGQTVGYAIETFSKSGFGGMIKVLVGFLPDGTINDTAVISQNETPGLGDKMDKSKSDFSEQFKGVDPSKYKMSVKKDGGDIDAISAATISSRAFAEAMSNAYDAFKQVNK